MYFLLAAKLGIRRDVLLTLAWRPLLRHAIWWINFSLASVFKFVVLFLVTTRNILVHFSMVKVHAPDWSVQLHVFLLELSCVVQLYLFHVCIMLGCIIFPRLRVKSLLLFYTRRRHLDRLQLFVGPISLSASQVIQLSVLTRWVLTVPIISQSSLVGTILRIFTDLLLLPVGHFLLIVALLACLHSLVLRAPTTLLITHALLLLLRRWYIHILAAWDAFVDQDLRGRLPNHILKVVLALLYLLLFVFWKHVKVRANVRVPIDYSFLW